MPKLADVIRAICLHMPEVEETVSHGSPEYRVRKKSFAYHTVNHHGDGRLALIVNADKATQAERVGADPGVFFVPAYTGPRGWYGIELSAGLPWPRVAELACEAYQRVAPASLADSAEPLAKVPKPDTVDLRKIDPFFFPKNQKLLQRLRKLCLSLPEVSEGSSFGSPVFRAGKKTFCQFWCKDEAGCAMFWVGRDGQAAFTGDERFDIPPYMGSNGWIRLRFDQGFDEDEVSALLLESYRHFALKRMLVKLDG